MSYRIVYCGSYGYRAYSAHNAEHDGSFAGCMRAWRVAQATLGHPTAQACAHYTVEGIRA